MNEHDWIAQVQSRIAISEGREPERYLDSEKIPTIGIGFNLERPDAHEALEKAGCADPAAVIAGEEPLSQAEISALFEYSFEPIIAQARASLFGGVFDSMTDARRFVICDLVYNLGEDRWLEFAGTRALLNQAQVEKNTKNPNAHASFEAAAHHLAQSLWYTQVGDRAKRDVAMLRTGEWCDPDGDGSDIA